MPLTDGWAVSPPSVKYRSARAGAVKVQFRSMWADRNGTHMTPMDKGAIDTVCIYYPETDEW